LITARTRRRFGFQRRRRVLFAWLITFPKCGPLPQSSHFIAIVTPEWEIQLGRNNKSIRESPGPETKMPLVRGNARFVRAFATRLDPAPHVPENEFMPVGV
jgi:hypothetical protein